MKNRSLVAAIIILGFFAFKNTKEDKAIPLSFKCPDILHQDVSKGFQFLHPGFMSRSQPVLIGKYTFTDSLQLPIDLDIVKEQTSEDIIYEYEARHRRLYLPMDGLQLIPDPDETVIFNTSRYNDDQSLQSLLFYPVYVVNETEEMKYLHLFNYEPLAIQEAKEPAETYPQSSWRPIEKRKGIGCTIAERYMKIKPGEFVMFIMPKYDGYFFTDIRVRLRNGANTLVSKPFPGNILLTQFMEDPAKDDKAGESYSPSQLDWFFFGSIPQGVDRRLERS